jgi:hypothetical protein
VSCARTRTVDWATLALATPTAESLRDELRPHLRVCAPCRRAALAADPSLLFCALPEAEITPLDVREMQQRIAGARRLLDGEGSRGTAAMRPLWSRYGGRAAAALLLPALALTALWIGLAARTDRAVPASAVSAPAPARDAGGLASVLHSRVIEQRLDGLPLVDDADSAPEVVYQVEGASFDLVLLVDAALELGGP